MTRDVPAKDEWHVVQTLLPFTWRFTRMSFFSPFLRLRGRGITLMGFLDPPLGYVWGESIKVTQQKPVDETYLNEVHQEVADAVVGIFKRHKARFGYAEDETLSLVSAADAKKKVIAKKRD